MAWWRESDHPRTLTPLSLSVCVRGNVPVPVCLSWDGPKVGGGLFTGHAAVTRECMDDKDTECLLSERLAKDPRTGLFHAAKASELAAPLAWGCLSKVSVALGVVQTWEDNREGACGRRLKKKQTFDKGYLIV